MNIKQLTFPAYFKQGSTYTKMLSEREFIQVKLLKTKTDITKAQNKHEIENILTGEVCTEDAFYKAVKEAQERVFTQK